MTLTNGTKIIIALRKYKDENGWWPDNLDQIQSLIAPDILVDPINGSSYVYKA